MVNSSSITNNNSDDERNEKLNKIPWTLRDKQGN